MSRSILLVEIGAADLPAVTPVDVVAAPWVPHVYVAPLAPPPGNVGVLPAADSVTITWDAVDGADEYIIETAPAAGGPWKEVARVRGTRYTYTTTSTAPIYFSVRAIINGKPGQPSSESGTPIRTPTQQELVELQMRQDAEKEARILGDLQALADAAADATAKADAALQVAMAHANGLVAQFGDILDADTWVVDRTYPDGDFVKHSGDLYRSLVEDNLGNDPATSPAQWLKVGEFNSVGEAVAASVAMGTQNATELAAESTRLDGVLARLPAGDIASKASVIAEQQARADDIAALALRVDTANAAIDGKASNTVVNLLSGRVDAIGSTVQTQGQAIIAVQGVVADKADSSALLDLSNKVSDVEGSLSAQGQAIIDVNSRVGAGLNEAPNMVPDPTFSAQGLWSSNYGGVWGLTDYDVVAAGPIQWWNAVPIDGRIVYCDMPQYVRTYAGQELTSSIEGRAGYTGGGIYVELLFYNEAREFLSSRSGTPVAGPIGYGEQVFDLRKKLAVSAVAPPNAAFIRIRVVWVFPNTGGVADQISFARPKLERGSAVTPYNDQMAAVTNASATIALRSRTSALEASADITQAALATMGGGRNMLENSTFDNGVTGYSKGWDSVGMFSALERDLAGSNWHPVGVHNIGTMAWGVMPAQAYLDINCGSAPVVQQKRYCLSAYVNAHRCYAYQTFIQWFAPDGSHLSTSESQWMETGGDGPATLLSQLKRVSVWGEAPGNAVTAVAFVRYIVLAGAENPYCWLFRPQLEEMTALQTGPSEWTPGSSPAQTASAVSTLRSLVDAVTGKVKATFSFLLDVNGVIGGMVSENDGQIRRFSVMADVFELIASGTLGAEFRRRGLSTYYLRFYASGVQLIVGINFGASNNLMGWYGPNLGEQGCTIANSTAHATNTGAAHFGGTLSAGVPKNANTSTQLSGTASVETGQFDTFGRAKVVTASFSYGNSFFTNTYLGENAALSAVLILERNVAGAGWVEVQRVSANGNRLYEGFEPGSGYMYRYNIGSSFNVTDSTPGAVKFNYRARLSNPVGWPYARPEGGSDPWGRQSTTILSVEP